MLIGVSSMLKYPLLVLILWLALRRKWTAAIAAVATISLIVLLSLIEFGPGMIRLWYDCCIGPFSKQPVAAINAQTLHAFVVRLMTGATWLGDFRPVPVTTGAGVGPLRRRRPYPRSPRYRGSRSALASVGPPHLLDRAGRSASWPVP